jgi:N-acetyl-anhydromuramyl-L-alanine amidase AmpD
MQWARKRRILSTAKRLRLERAFDGSVLPIKFLTIHCAATPEGRNVKAETVEAWDVARFNQPSYHWIVELDGHCHRSLQDDVRGAHTGGHNTGNIGICYVGGCDKGMHAKDTRTPQQRAALLQLVTDYQAKYPGITIRGHRDWPGVKKDCPSFDVRSWLVSEGLAQ